MRHMLDYYKTPKFAVDELLTHIDLSSRNTIIDPCCGNGEISNYLKEKFPATGIITNDINKEVPADYHLDAAVRRNWEFLKADVVITNPPFKLAYEIVTRAYEHVNIVILLLRLSFLEPTYDRERWLNSNPPNTLIVLPRISFTGDGKTDSVTVAWMVWDRTSNQKIIIARKI